MLRSSRYAIIVMPKAGPENSPKPPPFYATDVKDISPLIQLFEQVAKQQYKIKFLALSLKFSLKLLNPTEQL
jgi:hypothetical protein